MRMIVNNFGEAKRKLRDGMHNSLSVTGMYLSGKVRLDTPVQTGRLKGSIDYTVKDLELQVGTNVEYALAVHEGTRRQRPKRYIYNTAIREISYLKSMIAEVIKNNVGLF